MINLKAPINKSMINGVVLWVYLSIHLYCQQVYVL